MNVGELIKKLEEDGKAALNCPNKCTCNNCERKKRCAMSIP